jgi:Domain of unknown function (DUF4412)
MRAMTVMLFFLASWVPVASADYIVEQLVESTVQRLHTTMKLKETKYRFDIRELELSFLIDSTTNETIVLQHSPKLYIRLSAEHLRPPVGMMNSGVTSQTGADQMADLKPTGRREKINGYDTEEFVGVIGGMPLSVFVAKDFPNYQKIKMMLYNVYSSPALDACRNLLVPPEKYPGMPIRLVREVFGQKTCSTLQSVRETNLGDREFVIPTEYQEVKLDPP